VIILNKEQPGLTKKQREWILRRDDNKCQFVELYLNPPAVCHKSRKLQVHHISPRGWSYEHLGWTAEQVNDPNNLITLCEVCHLHRIHPDYYYISRKMFFYTNQSYAIVDGWHKGLTKAGVPYWITIWDETLKRIAQFRTRQYQNEHKEDKYPLA
jgi:hypothetical protein